VRRRSNRRPLVGSVLCVTDELGYDAVVFKLFSLWFLADPRRLCVLGVWLYLVGTAAIFLSLIDGMALTGLIGGFLLAWCGGWAKESGREKFRRHRLRGLGSAKAADSAVAAHSVAVVGASEDAGASERIS
jgi:hypothetical protein